MARNLAYFFNNICVFCNTLHKSNTLLLFNYGCMVLGLWTYDSKIKLLSDGKTFPSIILDKPTAKSHMSINSWTSPSPSGTILPISMEICKQYQKGATV